MDAVVLPLLSTSNPLDPEVLPPVRDGAFWEARWQPLRDERVLFISDRGCCLWHGETKQTQPCDSTCVFCRGNQRLNGLKPSYSSARWLTNDLPCFAPAGEVFELGIPEREASGARLVCETSEFMVWVPFFARYTNKVFTIPRGSPAFCADLDPAQQEPLVATVVEGPIHYHKTNGAGPDEKAGLRVVQRVLYRTA